jgi:hypothetical protein
VRSATTSTRPSSAWSAASSGAAAWSNSNFVRSSYRQTARRDPGGPSCELCGGQPSFSDDGIAAPGTWSGV